MYLGASLHKSLSLHLTHSLCASAVSLFPPKVHLEELRRLWDLLIELTQEKGAFLLQALRLQQYLQECADILEWIGDKV